MSEWLKETGCKPVGSAYAGSNPAPATYTGPRAAWRWLPTALVMTAIALPTGVASARSSIVFRCGDNICRVAPDGSDRKRLTTNGRGKGPSYGWLSATRTGSRLGVAFGNRAYILSGSGRRVRGPFRTGRRRPRGPDPTRWPPARDHRAGPGDPPVPAAALSAAARSHAVPLPRARLGRGAGHGRAQHRHDRMARPPPDARRELRTSPFEQGICLLASNTGFACGRPVAVDAGHDLWGPGRLAQRPLHRRGPRSPEAVRGGDSHLPQRRPAPACDP